MRGNHTDQGHLPGFEQLVSDAVNHILDHEDPELFINWFRQTLLDYPLQSKQNTAPLPEDSVVIATWLGRAIWNAVPLPGNGFRPRPLPDPGRNDPCPCDSGRKYKQCCARNPAPPVIDSQTVWPLVFARLPKEARDRAISMGAIPVDVLLELAYMHYEEHHPARAVKLLEPLFADVVRHPRAGHEYALDLLCNCYDELGHHVKKASLLQRVVKTTQRSSLRSGALQRQAAIFMDNHDIPGAWNAFRQALRDDPKSLNIGILEVQLLISENRRSEAKQRAVFWKKKLHRAGIAPDEVPMTFLSAVAADPGAAMKNVGLGMSGGAGAGLDDWLQSVRNRPVPKYQASTEPPGMSASPKEAMIEGLKQMGIPQQELERNLSRLQGEIDFDVPEDTEAGSEEPQQEDPLATLFLIAPPAIRKLETKWHEAIPLSKPFSVHDTPFGAYDPWDEQEEERWVAFLNDHPEAFDSLDIIDDLATLLMLHEDNCTQWLDEGLLKPLLQRAARIMSEALKGVESPTIVWGFAENRPLLRSLARLEFLASRQGNLNEAKMWANRLLNLNPDDNHGLRGMVINQLLRDGDDHGALKIADKYPEDSLPDTLYGRVLALYRLNRPEEAKKALFAAMDSLPKVSRHLTAARVRKPRIDPMGSIHGGDDQAWLYREEMRDLWLAAPGAIDWLKTSAKLHPVNS